MHRLCSTPSQKKAHGFFRFFLLLFLPLPLLFSGCAHWQKIFRSPAEREAQAKAQAIAERHAVFRATEGWSKRTYQDEEILAALTPENARLIVSLEDQRALLFAGPHVAIDFPVATGKRSHPTPTGSYKILEKVREHRSNLYGKVLDATGNVLTGMTDRRKAEIPEGGSFVGSAMPYWLRLTGDGVGFHVGHLPGRPASHGCIRMPRSMAPKIYSSVRVGTPVEILSRWPVEPEQKKPNETSGRSE